MSPVDIKVHCKTLCIRRCTKAVFLSVLMQFFLLEVFLLFVNFSILHPIRWIAETVSLLLELKTLLKLVPLIFAVSAYGIFLGKSYLGVRRYYSSRFRWVLGTALPKLISFILCTLIGFLTVWLYADNLHVDYRDLKVPCYGNNCINSRYMFLMFTGIAAGVCHFVKDLLRIEPNIEFPIIQEPIWVNIRNLLYETLYSSLIKSIYPTMSNALVFLFIGRLIDKRSADFFKIEIDESQTGIFTVFLDFRLLFYGWILSSQILSNMHLMQRLLSSFLSQQIDFLFEQPQYLAKEELVLFDALAMNQIPVIQNLTAQNLYVISVNKSSTKRKEIFSLSVPGGHPYNWNQLSGECLAIIEGFTDELAAAVKSISAIKTPPLYINSCHSATEAAERILLRQYNAMYGIRRMANEPPPSINKDVMQRKNYGQYFNDKIEQVAKQVDNAFVQIEKSTLSLLRAIPGVVYMFEEPDGAKVAFLLSNSELIVWLVQGLAGICATSLVEDVYGVVQVSLPQIIKAFIKLKLELDKLNNVNLNGKKMDRNLVMLRNAIKRSLYKICIVFSDYLRDIIDNPEDLRNLQGFLNYQET